MSVEEIKSKVERANQLLEGFQINGKPSNIINARYYLLEVKKELNQLAIIEHNQKAEQSKENEFIISGIEIQDDRLDDLIKKLNESKKIANEISSMTINVFDSRREFGNIEEYLDHIKSEFKETHGNLPDEINLVAVSRNQYPKPNVTVSRQLFRK